MVAKVADQKVVVVDPAVVVAKVVDRVVVVAKVVDRAVVMAEADLNVLNLVTMAINNLIVFLSLTSKFQHIDYRPQDIRGRLLSAAPFLRCC